MEQQRYRPSQAAQILGMAPWTLRRWIREGHVPAIRSNTGRWYIPASWIQQQLGTPPPSSLCDTAVGRISPPREVPVPPPVPVMWEYRRAVVEEHDPIKQLTLLGRDGWEVVSEIFDPSMETVDETPFRVAVPTWRYLLKRPKRPGSRLTVMTHREDPSPAEEAPYSIVVL